MFAGQRCRAIDSVKLLCAAFAGANPAVRAMPRREDVAPMTTMLPPPWLFICGMTRFVVSNRPRVFTRKELSRIDGSISSMVPHVPVPALYTRVCTGPMSRCIASNVRATDSASVTSQL